MNTKLHAVTDASGRPISFFITAGQSAITPVLPPCLMNFPRPNGCWPTVAMMPTGIVTLYRRRDHSLHSVSKIPQEDHQIRQTPLQTAQPDRDHVRASQRLAACRYALRPVPNGLSLRHRSRCDRYLLAMSNES